MTAASLQSARIGVPAMAPRFLHRTDSRMAAVSIGRCRRRRHRNHSPDRENDGWLSTPSSRRSKRSAGRSKGLALSLSESLSPACAFDPSNWAIAYFDAQKHRSSGGGQPDLTNCIASAELGDQPLELHRGIDDFAIPSSAAHDLQARRQGPGSSGQRQSHGRISNKVKRCRVSHERFADVTAPRSNPNIVRSYQGCSTRTRRQNEKLNLLKKGRNLR